MNYPPLIKKEGVAWSQGGRNHTRKREWLQAVLMIF